MKTIQAEAYRINKALEEVKASNSLELHGLYDSSEDIKNLLTKLENMIGGEYSIDDYGHLVYLVEVPQDIANLPEINDYLTKDYAFIYPHARKSQKDLWIGQSCGEFISVNFYHERSGHFVYDHETRTPIISNREDWMTSQYIKAMIEKHQRKTGVFGDVISLDYHGGYNSHYSILEDYLSDVGLDALIDSLTPKEDEE